MTELPSKKRPQSAKLERRLLTTSEAAHYLGRREYTVRKLVHDGELPVVQDGPGSPWKFDVRDLDDFIERKKQRA